MSFDPKLVAQLRADAPTVDALPLLAFTLEKLFRNCSHYNYISIDNYNNLGGMQGSIKNSAEKLFDPKAQPPPVVSAVRMAFVKHLAEPNEKGDFVRLSARWDEIAPLARPILDKFVTQRLLAKTKPDGTVLLEVAHEAIFRCWPLLTGWLSGSADILRWRRDIVRDQRSAKANGQKWRLSGTQFEIAKKWPKARREELNPEEIGWIKAVATQRSRIRVGLVLVAAIIVASAVVAWRQKGIADQAVVVAGQEQRLAESLRLVTESNAAFDQTPITSLLLAVEAARATRPDQPPPQARQVLRNRLEAVGGRQIANGGREPRAIAIAPNGERLVILVNDYNLLVWDLKNLESKPIEIPGTIYAVAFAPDGRIVTAEKDGFARVRDVGAPRKTLMELGPHEGELYYLAFAPDGRLATAGAGEVVRVWDLKNPQEPLSELTSHHEGVWSIGFNRAGRLVTTDHDFDGRVWDLTDPKKPKYRHLADVGVARDVAFGPGEEVATLDTTNQPHLWDLRQSNPQEVRFSRLGESDKMSFAPNGQLEAIR